MKDVMGLIYTAKNETSLRELTASRAVAALPVAVGLSGSDYVDPGALTSGYRAAMAACAALFAVGGVLAWATIRNDLLRAGSH